MSESAFSKLERVVEIDREREMAEEIERAGDRYRDGADEPIRRAG